MPAIPRGWTQNVANFGGGDATLTIPGNSTGIVHVLDAVYARITSIVTTYGGVGSAKVYAPTLFVSIAGVNVIQHKLIIPGNTATSDEVSLSGLGLIGPNGAAITLTMAGSGDGGVIPQITAQGYDL